MNFKDQKESFQKTTKIHLAFQKLKIWAHWKRLITFSQWKVTRWFLGCFWVMSQSSSHQLKHPRLNQTNKCSLVSLLLSSIFSYHCKWMRKTAGQWQINSQIKSIWNKKAEEKDFSLKIPRWQEVLNCQFHHKTTLFCHISCKREYAEDFQ